MHAPSSYSHSHQKYPHSRVLWGIKSKISELLDSEAFLLQSQELEKLFLQLIDALNTKVNKAWYDYKDYEQRLLRWEEEIEGILEQDQDLKVHYENILRAIKFAPYLKQTLWDKILFDRVLELWSPAQEFPESVTISYNKLKTTPSVPHYIMIKYLPSDASVQELEEVFLKIENAPWVLAIDLTYSNLWAFRKNQLQAIFSHLWNIRSIDLWNNNLWKLDEQRAHAVFSHLWDVRSIDLSGNLFWELDESRLQAIFSYLWSVKNINLWNNDLWQLDEPRLHAIFLHLSWVRSIDLIRNDLWVLWEDQLHAIFSHLGNVKSIRLSGNYLYRLDEPRLQSIFSHLWNVRSIDLRYNDLWHLDVPSLQTIFSHLVHIEEVILDSPTEVSKLESIFPDLRGKLKVP